MAEFCLFSTELRKRLGLWWTKSEKIDQFWPQLSFQTSNLFVKYFSVFCILIYRVNIFYRRRKSMRRRNEVTIFLTIRFHDCNKFQKLGLTISTNLFYQFVAHVGKHQFIRQYCSLLLPVNIEKLGKGQKRQQLPEMVRQHPGSTIDGTRWFYGTLLFLKKKLFKRNFAYPVRCFVIIFL